MTYNEQLFLDFVKLTKKKCINSSNRTVHRSNVSDLKLN